MVSRFRCMGFWLALLVAGCAAPAPLPPACPVGPPPVADGLAPLPPVSGARQVLRPGHWEWTGGRYVFETARWVVWTGPGTAQWQAGAWQTGPDGCVWVAGHFLS